MLADYQVAYNGVKVRIERSKVKSLDKLPGVTGVRELGLVTPDNQKGVQLIGAPSVWGGLAGLHGENIKIAVIDTGIDYTHANFGGPARSQRSTRRMRPTRWLLRPHTAGATASRAASTSSATTTTPIRTTRRTSRSRTRIRTRSTATGTARMSPAPPQARA